MSDELVELNTLEEDYDETQFWPELVLHASILLRGHISSLIGGRETSADYKNEYGGRIARWAFTNHDFRRQTQYIGRAFISDILPDVCGTCFYSFGLTTSGRHRYHCPQCKGEDRQAVYNAWTRRMELHRSCIFGEINDAVFCQLIYKYYSPNGDPKWEMKSYNLWKF